MPVFIDSLCIKIEGKHLNTLLEQSMEKIGSRTYKTVSKNVISGNKLRQTLGTS